MHNLLTFCSEVHQTKHKQQPGCPFCQHELLENIIDKQGDCIWLDNKFQTLQDVHQTVVIESSKHNGDFATYSCHESEKIITHLLNWWQEMDAQNSYASVALFKNFGYLSGGSLEHPHSQIVGFKNSNYYSELAETNFTGHNFYQKDTTMINISTTPITSFLEFNIIYEPSPHIQEFSRSISKVVKYLRKDYLSGICTSYNLFFYRLSSKVICKVIPRFPTSPYVIGYRFSQVLDAIAIRKIEKELLTSL